ncbi:MAG: hypothetical protein QXD81_02115 [Candidatus Bathyarchaeia archaeon]
MGESTVTELGPESPKIRVLRSATLAVGADFEKAEYELSLPLDGRLATVEALEAALRMADGLLEARLKDFASRTGPGGGQEPQQRWRQWASGQGESLREDLNPELAQILASGQHFGKNPFQAPNGYNYWLYPAEAEPGRPRYIQRVKRK